MRAASRNDWAGVVRKVFWCVLACRRIESFFVQRRGCHVCKVRCLLCVTSIFVYATVFVVCGGPRRDRSRKGQCVGCALLSSMIFDLLSFYCVWFFLGVWNVWVDAYLFALLWFDVVPV